jgi:hypothetical protein
MNQTITTSPLWHDPMNMGPSAFAALLARAAAEIESRGYTAYPDYEGEHGIDLHCALGLAAQSGPLDGTDAQDLADELEQRVLAVLIAAGVGTADLAGADLSYWERGLTWGRHGSNRGGTASKENALAILAAAAAVMNSFTNG